MSRARARSRARASTDGRIPVVLVIPAALGLVILLVPLAALAARAPWARLGGILGDPATLEALWLSLVTASAATLVCLVCGIPLAWLLARRQLPGRSVLRALVTVPLVLPPVVGGVALLVAFGRRGVVGGWLEETFSLRIPFTTLAVVFAQVFVAMPYLVIAVEGALRSSDRRFDDVAATLGATGLTTFRRVTLPAVAPGVVAGAALCWARALGEFGATITFAGSFPGTTRTLPVAAYVAIGAGDTDSAIVLSLIMIVVSVAILVALRGRWVSAA